MKVRSDNLLPLFSIEICPNKPGFLDVRMRENIVSFEENNNDLVRSGYDYDEYVLTVPDDFSETWVSENIDILIAEARIAEMAKAASLPRSILRARNDTDDAIEYAAENDYRICLMELGLTSGDLEGGV